MKNIIKNKKIFLLSLFLWLFFIALGAQAKDLEQSYPTFLGKSLTGNSTLIELIEYVYYFAIGLSGVAVFVMLVIGGVKWLTSFGNPSKLNDARDQIVSSILGLILLLSAVLILNTINPDLVFVKNPITSFTDKNLSNIGGLGMEGGGVVFYEDVDYSGGYFPMKEGEKINNFNLPDSNGDIITFRNSSTQLENKISSAVIATNNFAVICDDENFNTCSYLDSDQPNFTKIFRGTDVSWNDLTTSALVGISPETSPCMGVLLFEGKDRTINQPGSSSTVPPKYSKFYEYNAGACIAIPSGHSNSPPGPNDMGINHVKSLVISGACKVTLYSDDTNCGGSSLSFGNIYGSDSAMACDENTGRCCDNLSSPLNCTCGKDYNCIKNLDDYPFPTGGDWHDKADSIRIEILPTPTPAPTPTP